MRVATTHGRNVANECGTTRLRHWYALAAVAGGMALLSQFLGCVGPLRERTLYEHADVRIGIQTDLTTRTTPAAMNSHPYEISADDLRALLQSVEVSGWSGIVLGLFERPTPVPVFTNTELDLISGPMVQAFHQAGAEERVFFSIPGSQAPYPNTKERTAGALFFRDQFLHMVLTEHYAFSPADPGGGEERDPRDTRGMKLWVVPPARTASVPKEKEPEWGPFEKVHLSLQVRDVLAASRTPPSRLEALKPASEVPAAQTTAAPDTGQGRKESQRDDLQLQIRELTNANQDLRGRLKEQGTELEALRQEMDRLRQELSRASRKPSKGMSPAPAAP